MAKSISVSIEVVLRALGCEFYKTCFLAIKPTIPTMTIPARFGQGNKWPLYPTKSMPRKNTKLISQITPLIPSTWKARKAQSAVREQHLIEYAGIMPKWVRESIPFILDIDAYFWRNMDLIFGVNLDENLSVCQIIDN